MCTRGRIVQKDAAVQGGKVDEEAKKMWRGGDVVLATQETPEAATAQKGQSYRGKRGESPSKNCRRAANSRDVEMSSCGRP